MKLEIKVPSVAFTFDKSLTRKIMRQAGNEIKKTAQSLIGRDTSGRTYGHHTASGPGQPPSTMTGSLSRALRVKVKGDRVSIRETLPIGKYLETGAVGGGGKKGSKNLNRSHKRGAGPGKPQTSRKMLPRPYLSTALQNEMPNIGRRINEALSKGIDLKVLAQK